MTHWSRALLLMTPLLTTGGPAAEPRPSSALAALLAADWQYHLSHSPTYASILGDRRWNDRWDDLSLAGIEADHQHDVAFLEKLGKVTKGKLSDADKLNVELIGREHRERIEAHAARLESLSPLNVLARGYSLTRKEAGQTLLTDPEQVRPGDRIVTRLHRGQVVSRVEGNDG